MVLPCLTQRKGKLLLPILKLLVLLHVLTTYALDLWQMPFHTLEVHDVHKLIIGCRSIRSISNILYIRYLYYLDNYYYNNYYYSYYCHYHAILHILQIHNLLHHYLSTL